MLKTNAYLNFNGKWIAGEFATAPAEINKPVILEWPEGFKLVEMADGSMMVESPAGDIVTDIFTEHRGTTAKPYVAVSDNDYAKTYLKWTEVK